MSKYRTVEQELRRNKIRKYAAVIMFLALLVTAGAFIKVPVRADGEGHVHSWQYTNITSENGVMSNKVKAVCTNADEKGCDYIEDSNAIIITLSAPSDGNAAKVECSVNVSEIECEIKYYKTTKQNSTEGSEEIGSEAPTAAGYYYVEAYFPNADSSQATAAASFTITKDISALTDDDISISNYEFTYDGNEHSPTVTVKDGDIELIEGTHYSLSGNRKTDAETYKVTIKGEGYYTGTKELKTSWEIKKADLTVTAKDQTIIYGDEIKTDESAYDVDSLTENYEVSVELAAKNISASGESEIEVANVTVKNGSGVDVTPNYNITKKSGTLTVNPKPLTNEIVKASPIEFTYNGFEKSPVLTIEYKGNTLVEGTDYKISADSTKSATAVGEYKIVVTGKDNYEGEVTILWEIVAPTKDIAASADDVEVTYDKSAHGITVNVTEPSDSTKCTIVYGEKEGTYDKSASPTYTDAGTYTVYYKVTATDYEDYEGSATVTINPAEITVTPAKGLKKHTETLTHPLHTRYRTIQLNTPEHFHESRAPMWVNMPTL